ncbi:hypothetical protein RND81_04G234500 [Saponaria officinalis]|uniref:Neprosin PEP catalytic domain-containing protein n=1 Tax=Saponaria officinalis TaxID=3572 RepID=A0AAW1LP50_SAPOF
MAIKIVVTFFAILCSLFSNVICRQAFLEQHANTSIKTKHGQVFDCVPFHKQQAFSHPSLKFEVVSTIAEIQGQKPANFGLEGGGCPLGTVPILNTINQISNPISLQASRSNENCHAVIRTKSDNSNNFMGTRACMNLFKPKVQNNQWTSTRMKLLNGGESIEAGWMVNPSLFRNDEAHLYAKFSVGGKECINTQCSGFVQVSKQLPLGLITGGYSDVRSKKWWSWDLSIIKHKNDGNWWLSIHGVKRSHDIGYWPKSLFKSLAEVASQIEWGGEIYNPGASDPKPEMGSGYKAESDYSAFFDEVRIMDQGFKYVLPKDTEKFEDCTPFYVSNDNGSSTVDYGEVIVFGGPHE